MKIAWISFDFCEYSIRHVNAMAGEHDVLLALPIEDAASSGPSASPLIDMLRFARPRLRQPIRQLMVISRILRQLYRFNPDVVHFQHGHLWFNFALPLVRRFPLVVTIHDPRHHMGDAESRKTPQWVMDRGFRLADRVIVHGRCLVDIVHHQIGVDRERIDVVPHVALGEIEPGAEHQCEGSSVLFFGRIWPYKGIEYLIKAEPLISRRVPDVRITIAGAGEDISNYLKLIQNPQRFEILNSWVDDAERAALFRRHAVVVLPYVSATQSGVIPVAYAYSKPVVATEVGALAEAVEHGRTGLLVPPRDECALADAIVSLLLDPERRQQLGTAGHRRLVEEWSPQVIALQTIEVYRRAIEDRSHRRTSPGDGRRKSGAP